jgi:hypothetical protein
MTGLCRWTSLSSYFDYFLLAAEDLIVVRVAIESQPMAT